MPLKTPLTRKYSSLRAKSFRAQRATATERSRRRGLLERSSRTTDWISASDSSRRPSVTAPTIPRLREISSIIVSSIVSAASRYQAVTASCWPIRWQRSSAWSCIAGVHSRSRKATLEARVSVMPWPATRVAQTISCGPSGSWKASTAASRCWIESRPRMCSASGKRSTSSSCTSRWPAKTTSGSSEARKSSIQASAALALPRAASRLSALSCASRSARSAAAIFASSSPRSSGCSRSHAITSSWASLYSRWLSSATGSTTCVLAGSCGSTSDFSRRTKHERRRCQWMRSSAPAPWKRRAKRAPEPNSCRRPRIRSCAISSSGWFITGVPVSASRSAPSGSASASRRTACVRLARGFLT